MTEEVKNKENSKVKKIKDKSIVSDGLNIINDDKYLINAASSFGVVPSVIYGRYDITGEEKIDDIAVVGYISYKAIIKHLIVTASAGEDTTADLVLLDEENNIFFKLAEEVDLNKTTECVNIKIETQAINDLARYPDYRGRLKLAFQFKSDDLEVSTLLLQTAYIDNV
jgi:hypothetical protein